VTHRGRGDAPPGDPDDPWLPLGAASRLVGVGPDTLRRWADTGTVQSYQTPGGHRRFLRSSLEAMINAPRRQRYGVERLPDSQRTMAGELSRRVRRTGFAGQPWQARLSVEQRDDFRRWGQRTFQLVIEYVAASKRAERQLLLDEAERMGALYGSEASKAGLSLAETVEAFLFFRSPVLDAIVGHLRRRSADVSDVTAAFHEANEAIDQVLMSLVSSYRDGGGRPSQG
jgi:excisionase family DNA binding protein